MSLEFNRRSFLKYSAAAAVAVAGSSLLVGCGEDEYQKTGKIGSTLKLMGTFKTYKTTDGTKYAPTYEAGTSGARNTFKCTINIECTTKKVPLYVNSECFELTVRPGKSETNYAGKTVSVDYPEFDLSSDDGAKDFTVTVTDTTDKPFNFADGDAVEFKYWPRIQASSGNSGYTRAFCTWKMTAKVDSTTGKVTFE